MFKNLCLIVIFVLTAFMGYGQMSYTILHTQGDFMPEQNIRGYIENSTISTEDVVDNNYYRLIQFNAIPSVKDHEAIKNAGINLIEYLPHYAYVAAIPVDLNPDRFLDLNIRYISAIPQNWKRSDNVLATDFPDWATSGNRIKVSMTFPEDLDVDQFLAFCKEDGIDITAFNEYNNVVNALVLSSDITTLTQKPFIRYIELVLPPGKPEDTPGRAMHRANFLDTQTPGGRNYNGEGVGVLCRDDGEVGPHIDFRGRINQDYVGPDRGTHGDGVSGIMAGAGNLNPRNRGMAAGSDLFVIDYQANFLDETMDLHLNNNVLVTNSSYSNGCNRGYTNTTITVDQQMYDNPTLLHVFSAGNSNNLDCDYGAGDQWGNITGGHKQGKNVIATANLNRYAILESSSSRGPAHDGRIKPDISAHGQGQVSTAPDNGYMSFGGTSAAAPGIAGVSAMLHQAYRELNGGEVAEAALIKSILLNSANDLGNKGPDFKFGWGHVNALRAVEILENNHYLKDTVEPGEMKEITLEVPDNLSELRVMVYWADPEASNGISKALINNIDINMMEGQEVYLPWILDSSPDPSKLNTPAVKGYDGLNNMEQVAIDNPTPGSYTLNIAGTELPFGAHEFYVVWEYRVDEFRWIYPAGGEKIGFLDTEVFHWETPSNGEPFGIEISVDAGTTWSFLDNVDADTRLLERGVPHVNTDSAQMRVTRSGETFTSNYFTITNIPRMLTVARVCPDSILLDWENIEEAVSYDVYELGEKFMEYVLTVDSSETYVPVLDPREENWFAVGANFDGGIKGRRSNAIESSSDELVDCDQTLDLRFLKILEPSQENSLQCMSPLEGNVVVEVLNNGLDTIRSIAFSYSIDGATAIVENYDMDLPPDSILIYTFDQGYVFTESREYTFDIFTDVLNEQAGFDNSKSTTESFYLENGVVDLSEDFTNVEDYPEFWYLDNDDDLSWAVLRDDQIDGETGNVLIMPFFNYNGSGQRDAISLIPIDLTAAAANTYLSIDMAYFYTNVSDDQFRIMVSTDCGQTFNDTIYYLHGRELATSPALIFSPNSADNWKTRLIPLADYVGMDNIVIQLEAINDNGNNLYLDNINITTADLEAPESNFGFFPLVNCALDTLEFFNSSTGTDLEYRWEFGIGSFPAFSYDRDPGEVVYLVSGAKEVKLLTFNGLGRDTIIQTVNIYGKPTGDFTYNHFSAGQVYFFSADINDGMEFSWDFGDGGTSDIANPLHNYAATGSYLVKLDVRNECQSASFVNTVDVDITSVNDVTETLHLNAFPNPTTGHFVLSMNTAIRDVEKVTIRSVDGRELAVDRNPRISNGEVQLDLGNLSSGLYIIKLDTSDGSGTTRVVLLTNN